ncbi:hypothetical protein AZE42_10719 [Rhizopogon vesiculosus]|uniref:Cytochrome P450 n=1 Tax=Rhizopogon vesiculosus TaxID=180088 RepID=A0A1J8QRC0_9AGAM|nr:hypothetical protein AZE42_10719 [Rhizopogon vesiculosus]
MSSVFDHRVALTGRLSSRIPGKVCICFGADQPPFGYHGPRKIAQWINEYGPVISLNKGKDVLVIVERYQEAIDIMEKQGASLADRPRSVAGSEILGRGMRFGQIGSGERFRKFRKASHTHLQLKSAQNYEPAQLAYARDTILDLLDSPTLHQLHIKRFAASVILRFKGAMMPGAYLVDKYPILKYIPGYGRNSLAWREEEYEMLYGKLNWIKSQVTAVAISTVMMAAACFPHSQAHVHEELEAVVGRETPPTFEDWSRLVQPQAFILEALRWRPVNPIGLPHRNGMCIPVGATVFENHWSISRDPAVYRDLKIFDPQRWIGTDGEIKDNMRLFTFGFGRRACPGLHVANRCIDSVNQCNISMNARLFRSIYTAAALVL